MGTLLSLSLIAVMPAQTIRPGYLSTHDVPWSKTGHPLNGTYRLTWDDKIDGKIDANDRVCELRITVRGEEVFGEFIKGLPGKDRKALISGRLEGGNGIHNILSFRQIEEKYTCSYQMSFGGANFLGVWHDTNGDRGDFLLLKYQ